MIWPLFAYRRRGRRIDPGPAIPSADRAAGILPLAKVRWRRAARSAARTAGGRAAIMPEVVAMSGFRPARFRNERPARRHRISRWVDRMAAAGLTEPRCASERGLDMGGGPPAERRFTVGAAANPWLGAIARCSRTGSSNPSPSSGESGANREAAVSRGCSGWGERRGRQRRARSSNIALRSGSVSVGRYSSTALSPMRFATVGAPLSGCAPLGIQQYCCKRSRSEPCIPPGAILTKSVSERVSRLIL